MTLTKRQFELGVDEEGEDCMRQIYDLLATHNDVAYSRQEIQREVLGTPTPVTKLSKFKRALGVLVGIGALDQRKVSRKDY